MSLFYQSLTQYGSSMSREQLVVERARRAFQTGMSKPLKFRVHQLKNLHRFITERRKDIADAVNKDLNKVSVGVASQITP